MRPDARHEEPPRHTARVWAGTLGVTGSLACGISMVLVAVGVGVSVGATGMAAMSGGSADGPHGLLGALLRAGPWLLLVSAMLVTLAFALTRRPVTALPALLAGTILYVGMYAQPDLSVMYLSIALGYAVWIALYLWTRAVAPCKAVVADPGMI